MTGGRRAALLPSLAGLLILLSAPPAEAHPLTGGPATPGQIVVTVAGLVLVVLGGIGAFADVRVGRSMGVPLLLAGLVTIFVGPDVVTRYNSRCSVRPSAQVRLKVPSPSEGEQFGSNAVPVRIEVEGGTLADASVNKLIPGKGHLQVSVDRILVTRASNPVQVLQMGDGSHQIVIEYVAGDHLPFCPKVAVTRNVKVRA